MDLDLATLKREILEYLDGAGFAVFHSQPGGLEGLPKVLWDSDRFPDYQIFLEAARKVGVKLILFASRDFDFEEIEDATEQLELAEVSREDRREYERRLRDMRVHEGVTCSIELAFDHNARMYVYELFPDWYEEFQGVCDEIAAQLPSTVQGDDGSSGGIFPDYSNN